MTNNMKRFWLILGVFAILSGYLVWKRTFRPSDTNVASKKTEAVVSANTLIKAYASNEDSTNMLYLNKIVEVTGKVDTILEKDGQISVYLKEKSDTEGVMCAFNKTEIDTSSVKVGQIVSVKGICTGYLMDVILTKCSVNL